MIINLLVAVMFAAPAIAAGSAPAVVLSTAARTSANERLAARCAKPSFGVDELLADAKHRADLMTSSAEEERDLMEYSMCRALQEAAGGCASLEGTKASSAHCQTLAAEARFAFQTLRGGDALAACRSVMALDNQRGPAIDKSCGVLIKAVRDGNVAGSCATLASEKIIGPGNTCEDIQAMWSGATKDCDRQKDPGTRRECLARAALVGGLREPARCASSPACQALAAKSPGACDGLRAQFTRTLCARVAKEVAAAEALVPKRPDQIAAEAKEKAAKAQAAKVAAAAAAVAAEKAKVEAAAAKAKAEALAEQGKVAKLAAASAAKKAADLESVKAKLDAEAKKAAKAKADIAKQKKPQFSKGAPMVSTPVEAKEIMKALEEGKPLPTPKAAPKKVVPKEEAAPADQ